jgi:hypothetical protein
VLGTNPWFKKPRVIGEKVGKIEGRFKGFAWGNVRINLYSSA